MAHTQSQADQALPSSISTTYPTASSYYQHSFTPAAYGAYYASQPATSTSQATSDGTAVTASAESSNGKRKAGEPVEDESAKKKRVAREEDALLMREAAHRVAQAILADQLAVTYPDYKTPFRDAADAVQRLLPYHIFQQPDEDLLPPRQRSLKGKEKEDPATRALREDVDETKSALSLFKRRKALKDRFRAIRTKEAKRDASIEQQYQVQYLILDDDRRYNAMLNTEVRGTRDQLAQMEKDQKEQKEKQERKEKDQREQLRHFHAAYAPQYGTPAAAATAAQSPTARASAANPYAVYSSIAGTVPISSAEIHRQAQAGDYRAAYASYAQAWVAYAQAQVQAAQRSGVATTAQPGSAMSTIATAIPSATAASPKAAVNQLSSTVSASTSLSPVLSTTPLPPSSASIPTASTQPAGTSTQPTASTTTTATQSATTAPRSVPTHPIPLQIPSSALPAFQSLRILPVPAADAALKPDNPPPAILVGARENGQMLDITINLSLLDPSQLSGLAAVLNVIKTSGVSLTANGTPASPSVSSPTTARAAGPSTSPVAATVYPPYYQYYQPPAQPAAQPLATAQASVTAAGTSGGSSSQGAQPKSGTEVGMDGTGGQTPSAQSGPTS